MKKISSLFIVTLLVQNLSAQDVNVVYVDEYGNRINERDVVWKQHPQPQKPQNVIDFKDALPLQKSSNQIVVRTIDNKTISTSSHLTTGQNYYLFEVVQADDSSLIGKPVICKVIDIRKSNISGSEGRMFLQPLYVEKGTVQIPLAPNAIYRRGKNLTNVKFWLSFLIVPVFIPGSGAKIKPEEFIILNLGM